MYMYIVDKDVLSAASGSIQKHLDVFETQVSALFVMLHAVYIEMIVDCREGINDGFRFLSGTVI